MQQPPSDPEHRQAERLAARRALHEAEDISAVPLADLATLEQLAASLGMEIATIEAVTGETGGGAGETGE